MIIFVQFSHLVMCDSLQRHGLQHPRLPCPSPTSGAYSNSRPSSRWCHPIISFSVVPFSSHLQSFPASGSFPVSRLFGSPGSFVHGIFQARILEWVVLSYSRESSWLRHPAHVSCVPCVGRQIFLLLAYLGIPRDGYNYFQIRCLMDKISIIEQLFEYLILPSVSYHYFSSKYSPEFFYFKFLLWFFGSKMFLKIPTMEYNCKLKCFMWLGGYDGYIYLLQLLTFFSYELCCLPFLIRTLRFHTEMWVEFCCYY